MRLGLDMEERRIRKETMEELIFKEMTAKTQREKDIIHLKMIAHSIKPYSRWWRWGFLGSVKRAIRALENTEVKK